MIPNFDGYCLRHVALSKWSLAKYISVGAMTVDGSYTTMDNLLWMLFASRGGKVTCMCNRKEISGLSKPICNSKEEKQSYSGYSVCYVLCLCHSMPWEISPGYTSQIFRSVISIVQKVGNGKTLILCFDTDLLITGRNVIISEWNKLLRDKQ